MFHSWRHRSGLGNEATILIPRFGGSKSSRPSQAVGLHAPVLFGTCHHISQGGAAPEGRPAAFMPAPVTRITFLESSLSLSTSPSFGNRILVSDLLHQPARKGNSIDSLRETAVIDQLLAPIAEQLRRVRNRILYQFNVERHQDAGRHGEALGRIEPSGQRCPVRERTLKALIDQPKLDAAEQVLDDQASDVCRRKLMIEKRARRMASSTSPSSDSGASRAALA